MGESGSGKVVAEVKNLAKEKEPDSDLLVVDSAAGIGCPVIASVNGSAYAIAVTEPTPSSLADLERALALVSHFGIKVGIIINKFDLNNEFSEKIESFAKSQGLEIIAKIPYDREFVKALVNLTPAVIYNKKFEELFSKIAHKVESELENL